MAVVPGLSFDFFWGGTTRHPPFNNVVFSFRPSDVFEVKILRVGDPLWLGAAMKRPERVSLRHYV